MNLKPRKKTLLGHGEELPWDLMEEILSRVPPKSLVRFRTACKRWNSLFNDKKFINNHKMTFRFILTTKSKIYSVNVIDLEIEVRELSLEDIPGLNETQIPRNLVNCNDFLLSEDAIWNPWSRQSRGIVPVSMVFEGVGYDNKRACYKILASLQEIPSKTLWRIYDFASDTWKDFRVCGDSTEKQNRSYFTIIDYSVSLDGILYSLASHYKTNEEEESLCIAGFEFSREKSFGFCDIPCERNHRRDALVLGVFKGDRFSLLEQCFATKKIQIWVTENKISWDRGEDVVWVSFMQVSIPNFPDLVVIEKCSQPSYFIDDKRRLVVCSCDENGRAWIYVVSEDKLLSKTRIDSVVDLWPSHCTYTPSLVPVPPLVQREHV